MIRSRDKPGEGGGETGETIKCGRTRGGLERRVLCLVNSHGRTDGRKRDAAKCILHFHICLMQGTKQVRCGRNEMKGIHDFNAIKMTRGGIFIHERDASW